MRVANIDLINGTPIDLDANANLAAVNVASILYASIQLVFSSTVTGAFKLQKSDDAANTQGYGQYQGAAVTPTNWTDIANTSTNVTTGGTLSFDLNNIGYTWVRVVFTDASSGMSTGQLTSARMTLKGA